MTLKIFKDVTLGLHALKFSKNPHFICMTLHIKDVSNNLLLESAFQCLNNLYFWWKPALQYFIHAQQGKRNTAALCRIEAVPRGHGTYYTGNSIKVINADLVIRAVGLLVFIKWQKKSQRPIAIINNDVVNLYGLKVGYALL